MIKIIINNFNCSIFKIVFFKKAKFVGAPGIFYCATETIMVKQSFFSLCCHNFVYSFFSDGMGEGEGRWSGGGKG